MGKTNEARACEVVSDVLGTVNWEMGDGGHIIIFDQSKAIHLTLNEIYTHVLKAIDKAEKRGRRKVCCEPAPQIDTEKVRGLIGELIIVAHQLGRPVKKLGKKEISDVLHRADLYHDALLTALHIE